MCLFRSLTNPKGPKIEKNSRSPSRVVWYHKISHPHELLWIPRKCHRGPQNFSELPPEFTKILPNSLNSSEIRAWENFTHFVLDRGWELNTNFFCSQTFRAPPGYPGKIPGYPAQEVWFPWFRGTYRTFGPHPCTWKTPSPPENIRTQSLGLGSFFVPD